MGIHGSPPSYSGTNRVMMFIDGGYLKRQFENAMGTNQINYSRLANDLVSWSKHGNLSPELVRAYYYDAKLFDEDVDRMKVSKNDLAIIEKRLNNSYKQNGYFDVIHQIDFFDVRLGSLRITNGKLQQKGVDTLLAIDMISKAYERQYDEAMIIAGDKDFVKVVEAVKQISPKVFGVYFKNRISPDLFYSFDRRKELNESILKYWKLQD